MVSKVFLSKSYGDVVMRYLFASIIFLISNVSYAGNIRASHTLNALGVLALYFLFCAWFIYQYKKRAAQTQLNNRLLNADAHLRDENSILVAYASQTGNAEQLAQKTAESLKASGLTIEIHALAAVNLAMLHRFSRALFVVSTTGEGDAPDNATDFLRNVMHSKANLTSLKYSILALGDASYTHFCGFGQTLNTWLQHLHAIPLFDIVEVDRNDEGALRHWQYQLSTLAQDTEMVDWKTPDYQDWKLSARTLLNTGSVGAPVYHLKLTASHLNAQWQAGDIAEVGPRNSPTSVALFLRKLALDGSIKVASMTLYEALLDKLLPHDDIGFKALIGLNAEAVVSALKTLPHREYSIASIPQDGGLELVVRQTHYADGRLGIGSGWLTEYAALENNIALRVRVNATFHPPTHNIPMLLIGNGTGIAGLRALLKNRAAINQGSHWLIFGERNAEYDFYFKDELNEWLNLGILAKLETAFSRDHAERIYVQDVLLAAASDVVSWVENGAAIYVCGSANGMAPAVHSVLLSILGETTLSALTASGRYRRDVY